MEPADNYPAYPLDLIREIVTVAHFDLNRLKELIGPRPHLVKVAWDWGFGDLETPLGAACHMGRRDIAEYLLSQGAMPSLFSSVLFGDLRMVKEIVERNPGIQRVPGPHSISLVAHARMAGKPATEVLSYFESLGDADLAKPIPLTDQDSLLICGPYLFGDGASQTINVSDDMKAYANTPMYSHPPQLNWTRIGTMGRPLFHVGQRVFYPAGAPTIEVSFHKEPKAIIMAITDGERTFTARRLT